jgi:hypothetical protein
MKSKLEIVAKLLKESHITVEEAVTLLETHYVPNHQQIGVPNYQPIADWTYRPSPIYCGTTQTSNINKSITSSGRMPEYGC